MTTQVNIGVTITPNPNVTGAFTVTYYENGSKVGSSFIDPNNFGNGFNLSFTMLNSPTWFFAGIGMYVGVPGYTTPELSVYAVGGSNGATQTFTPTLTIPTTSYLLYSSLSLPSTFGSVINTVVQDSTSYAGTPSFMFQFVDANGNTFDADPSVPTDPT